MAIDQTIEQMRRRYIGVLRDHLSFCDANAAAPPRDPRLRERQQEHTAAIRWALGELDPEAREEAEAKGQFGVGA